MKHCALLLILFSPVIALAHVQLDHAEPKTGSTIDHAPKEIKVWFDGPVGVAKSKLDVTDADGHSISGGALHGDEKDNTVLILPIQPVAGKVTVKWDAYCPDCDHTTHGTFSFTVR